MLKLSFTQHGAEYFFWFMIGLTITYIIILASFFAGSAPVQVLQPAEDEVLSGRSVFEEQLSIGSGTILPIESNPILSPVSQNVEYEVRNFFKDRSILIRIAWCESRFKHYDSNGGLLRGHRNKNDVGVMQINEFYHADNALHMGYDLYTPQGNLGYAKWLFERHGTEPWFYSRGCWSNSKVATTS